MNERCIKYRKRILEMSQGVPALHVAPAFSCLEITDVIYNELMRKLPSGGFQDIFLMSKGHGCLAQYVILDDLGVFSEDDLLNYCKPQGRLGAHPDYGVPGIEGATGSLGHGAGLAVGMAYANKLSKSDSNVYLVLSDGELQEGSTWEAIAAAVNLKTTNIIAFLDLNDVTSLEKISEKQPAFYPVLEKLEAFGWEVKEVDGHDHDAMREAVANRSKNKPMMVVCKTIKGKGVSYMENVPIWHYRSPSVAEYKQAMQELDEVAS